MAPDEVSLSERQDPTLLVIIRKLHNCGIAWGSCNNGSHMILGLVVVTCYCACNGLTVWCHHLNL